MKVKILLAVAILLIMLATFLLPTKEELSFPRSDEKIISKVYFETQGTFQGNKLAYSRIEATLTSEPIKFDSTLILRHSLSEVTSSEKLDSALSFYTEYSLDGEILYFFFPDSFNETKINLLSTLIKTFYFKSNKGKINWKANLQDTSQSKDYEYSLKKMASFTKVTKSILDKNPLSQTKASCELAFKDESLKTYDCIEETKIFYQRRKLGETKLQASLVTQESHKIDTLPGFKPQVELKKYKASELILNHESKKARFNERLKNKSLASIVSQSSTSDNSLEKKKELYFELEAFLYIYGPSKDFKNELLKSAVNSEFFMLASLALSHLDDNSDALVEILEEKKDDSYFLESLLLYLHNVKNPKANLLSSLKELSIQGSDRALLALATLSPRLEDVSLYRKYLSFITTQANKENEKALLYIDALANVGQSEALAVIVDILKSSRLEKRIAAAQALRSFDIREWEYLVFKLFNDPEKDLRYAFSTSLKEKKLGEQSLLYLLNSLATESSKPVKTQILQTLINNQESLKKDEQQTLQHYITSNPELLGSLLR